MTSTMQSTPALDITPATCEHASSCSTCPSEASTSPSTTSASTTPFSSVPVTPADELSDELFPMDSAIKGDVSSTLHSALRREKDKDSVEANVKGLLGRSGSLTRAARRAKEAAKTGLKMLKKKDEGVPPSPSSVSTGIMSLKERFGGTPSPRRPKAMLSQSQLSVGKQIRIFSMPNLPIMIEPKPDPQQEHIRGVSGSASAKSLARTHTPTPSKLQLVSTAESTAPSLASLPRSPAALLRAVLFPLWVLLVGAALLLCPHFLPALVFGTGYAAPPSTPLHRLAHYAHTALPHAAAFAGALLGVAAWQPRVGAALAVAVLARVWTVWGAYDGKACEGADGAGWEFDMRCVYVVLMGREEEVVVVNTA